MASQEKFVERFSSAITEFAILNVAAQRNNITPDHVISVLPKSGIKNDRQAVTERFDKLVEDGHLRKEGNGYSITDDGREDVQKLQSAVMELPQLIQSNMKGGVPQKPGMQQTVGGQPGGSYGTNVQGGAQGNPQGGPQNPRR